MSRNPARRVPRQNSFAAKNQGETSRLLGQGYEHLRQARADLAEPCFKKVLAATRSHPEARRGLGHVELARREYEAAVEQFQRAAKGDPTRGELHGELGRALQLSGQIDKAMTAFERSTRHNPEYVAGWCGQAEILERRGYLEEAHAAFDKAQAAEPESEILVVLIARLHQRQGRHQEALEALRNLIAQSGDPALVAQAHILVGRSLDRTGKYEEAYQHVARGKGMLTQNTRGCDALRAASRALDDFKAQSFRDLDQDRIDRWNTNPVGQAHQVAFLVGFPRSGTTLMERVLGAHPDILATDESPFIGQLWTDVRRLDPSNEHLLDVLDGLSSSAIARLQRTYFRRVEKLTARLIGSRWVVDKMPLNLLALPLIAKVFPKARIIFAERDPRDIVVSCFMRLGERPDADSVEFLTMNDCVERYCRVARLWSEFEDRCPLPSLRVRYEDVVRGLENQSRRMARFLELDWDKSMLRFDESRQGVYLNAPTHEDVGQHLYIRALERWRRYRFAFSAEQLKRLSPLVQSLGYDDAA